MQTFELCCCRCSKHASNKVCFHSESFNKRAAVWSISILTMSLHWVGFSVWGYSEGLSVFFNHNRFQYCWMLKDDDNRFVTCWPTSVNNQHNVVGDTTRTTEEKCSTFKAIIQPIIRQNCTNEYCPWMYSKKNGITAIPTAFERVSDKNDSGL